jgi:hypothetical protein
MIDKFAIIKKDTAIVSVSRPVTNIETVQAFPNPFKKDLTVELTLKKSDYFKITITSVDGKLQTLPLWSGNMAAGKTQLHLGDKVSALPAGNYLLNFENKEGTQAEQLVKL